MSAKKIVMLVLMVSAFFLAGCDQKPSKAAVTGLIDHPHRMTLPDGTMVIVRIEDTTRPNSPGKKVAEQVITSKGEAIPMPFAVVYDPGKIKDNHTYSITVKIEDSEGKVLYINETNVLVLTQGNPTHGLDVFVGLAGE